MIAGARMIHWAVWMENAEAEFFRCQACGKQFRWRNELAGRQVRCPYGQVMQCPKNPPSADEMYDIAPDPARPGKSDRPAAAKSAPVVPTLSYQTPRSAEPGNLDRGVDPELLKKRYAPLWLLCGGIVVEVISAYWRHPHDVQDAMIQLGIGLVGGTIVMLAGVLLAAKIRKIDIGSFGSAALRLAAIGVAPMAVGDLLWPLRYIICLGGLLILGVQFVLYFALLGALFDLDQSDTWYCVIIIFLVYLGVYFLLLWIRAR
jgi:hypothetical protein